MKRILFVILLFACTAASARSQSSSKPTPLEPTNATDADQQKTNEESQREEKYQAWVSTLTPQQQAWERVLQSELGGFYLPIHQREKVAGKSNAWDFVQDDPNLPRVLLIGDSVSRSYTPTVRKELEGKANVHRAPANCGPTATGLKKLDVWLGDGKWDIIHFNFGIHDRATPVADYSLRLEQLVKRMQQTGATLVWASTTPIPDDPEKKNTAASIIARNTAAAEVMQKQGIAINDLFTAITPQLAALQNPNDVHFNSPGNEFLGKQVAMFLQMQLLNQFKASAELLNFTPIANATDPGDLRSMKAELIPTAAGDVLSLAGTETTRYAWATLPASKQGWDFARRASVEASITNRGPSPRDVMLWVVPDHGWDAVVDSARLAPGESRRFSCDLRATFPDGTPKLDPTRVRKMLVMVPKATADLKLELRDLRMVGEASPWTAPPARLEVPDAEVGVPAAGRRVKYQLAGDEQTNIYSVLQLPNDWKPGMKFPLIVEFPGNIFYTQDCYSTGLPDQCVIGYGITKGSGTICVSLPFIDRAGGGIAEHGWGNADETAEYTVQVVKEICAKFGGDEKNVLLTGFSRGAIACGYIGLRNDHIASLWKGFHACQHYDGDGWNGATMDGAMERARRFKGKAVFQTDNSPAMFQPLMDAMGTEAIFASSGLGAHACAMFLDDRPSTLQLREWFVKLVSD